MPKVVSDKQLAANRANAQRCTGPKSPEGKTRSSQNALKHGLLAKNAVINVADLREDRAQFNSILAELCEALNPRDFLEDTLVERMATCYWRLRRAQYFEQGAIREMLETKDPGSDALSALRDKLKDTEEKLETAQYILQCLDKPLQKETEPFPDFAQMLRNYAELHGIEDCTDLELQENLKKSLPSTIEDVEEDIENLRIQLREAQKDDELRRRRRPLLNAVPNHDPLMRLVRYETMLDRQFHRSLAELRRLRAAADRKKIGCLPNETILKTTS